MADIKIEAVTRTAEEKQNNKLRETGYLPTVIYGPKVKNQSLKVKTSDLEKSFAKSGKSSIVDLVIDGKDAIKVMFKDIQKDSVTGNIFHADFYAIDPKKKIEVMIPLKFIGESKAVKTMGGTLLRSTEAVKVKCLPDNLIKEIEVNLEALEDFSINIRVKDLQVPETVELTENPYNPIAGVLAPRIAGQEDEEEATETPATEEEDSSAEASAKEETK